MTTNNVIIEETRKLVSHIPYFDIGCTVQDLAETLFGSRDRSASHAVRKRLQVAWDEFHINWSSRSIRRGGVWATSVWIDHPASRRRADEISRQVIAKEDLQEVLNT